MVDVNGDSELNYGLWLMDAYGCLWQVYKVWIKNIYIRSGSRYKCDFKK